jgi:hypothetical protein
VNDCLVPAFVCRGELSSCTIAQLHKRGRSASLVRDAGILLQADAVDYILISSDSPQVCSEPVVSSLQVLVPTAHHIATRTGLQKQRCSGRHRSSPAVIRSTTTEPRIAFTGFARHESHSPRT